jgi:hypothetical protein
MTKMKVGDTVRQGDVLLMRVAADVDTGGSEVVAEDHGALPIAYGESTHHRHQVAGLASGNKLFRRGSVQFLEVSAKGGGRIEVTSDRGEALPVERHDPIALPKGTFGIVVQEEYTPEAYRPVGD